MTKKDYSHINQLHPTERRWFAVKTRVKSEKLVSRRLQKKGIYAYVPLQRFMRHYSRSTRLTEKPLINCYVFVNIRAGEYRTVLETEHVSGFVQFDQSLIAIPDEEIAILRKITLESGLDIVVRPADLTAGDPVEICAGHLTGLKGEIIKADGKRRFHVQLERLGYSLLLNIDAAFLQKTKVPLGDVD